MDLKTDNDRSAERGQWWGPTEKRVLIVITLLIVALVAYADMSKAPKLRPTRRRRQRPGRPLTTRNHRREPACCPGWRAL